MSPLFPSSFSKIYKKNDAAGSKPRGIFVSRYGKVLVWCGLAGFIAFDHNDCC